MEQLVMKFHHTKTSVVELFIKSEDCYRGTPSKVFSYRTSLYCNTENRVISHIFWKHSFNNYLKNLSTLFQSNLSLWISSCIEMCYARLEKKKASWVESLSREIANTLLIRESSRTFESQKSAEILVNIHGIFFKSKIKHTFLSHHSTIGFLFLLTKK